MRGPDFIQAPRFLSSTCTWHPGLSFPFVNRARVLRATCPRRVPIRHGDCFSFPISETGKSVRWAGAPSVAGSRRRGPQRNHRRVYTKCPALGGVDETDPRIWDDVGQRQEQAVLEWTVTRASPASGWRLSRTFLPQAGWQPTPLRGLTSCHFSVLPGLWFTSFSCTGLSTPGSTGPVPALISMPA